MKNSEGVADEDALVVADARELAAGAVRDLAARRLRRSGGKVHSVIMIPGALSGEQEAVLISLLAGKTQAEAAKKAGVVPETVSRWMHNDALFVAELNRRRAELWEGIADRLRAAAVVAVDTLSEVAKEEGYETADRIRAASAILKAASERPAGKPEAEQIARDWAISRSGDDLTFGLLGVSIVRQSPEGEG